MILSLERSFYDSFSREICFSLGLMLLWRDKYRARETSCFLIERAVEIDKGRDRENMIFF